MEVEEEELTNCTVGGNSNMTLQVMVPVMKNSVLLQEGEKLYLSLIHI